MQREKEYEIALNELEGDFLRIRIVTERGRMVDFLVQYETTITDKRVAVVHYDGSHEECHRDQLDPRGKVVAKRWFGKHLTRDECVRLGRRDLTVNWERYKADFFGATS